MRPVRSRHRWHAPQVRYQRSHVAVAHPIERRVGHHRAKHRTIRAYPKPYRVDDLAVGPGADARGGIWGDIRAIKCSIRSFERPSSSVNRATFSSVTATATSQGKNILATGDKLCLYCLRQLRSTESGHSQNNGEHINDFPHQPSAFLVKVYLLLLRFLAGPAPLCMKKHAASQAEFLGAFDGTGDLLYRMKGAT